MIVAALMMTADCNDVHRITYFDTTKFELSNEYEKYVHDKIMEAVNSKDKETMLEPEDIEHLEFDLNLDYDYREGNAKLPLMVEDSITIWF